jgi:uncharacterized membrane protein
VQSNSGSNRVSVFADRVVMWLSRHWLACINAVVAMYVGLPFLAPVMIKSGHPFAAQVVYTVYAPLCHQLPQRSYFLFGEKPTYSLQELADRVGEENLALYPWPRLFNGNAQVGYKVALCERDVAIYGALFLSGVAFSLVRSRAKPLPFWTYILIGIIPMGLDGGSQFISYLLQSLIPGVGIVPRESTWLLRTVTGGLFGWATAWLAFPNLQAAFAEVAEHSRARLESEVGGRKLEAGDGKLEV